MTKLPDNYKNLCRACFNPIQVGDSNISNLFHTNVGKTTLSKMFMGCTSIKISPDDNLPQNICGVCASWIDLGDEFRRKCLDSDHKFKAILKSSESESFAAFMENALMSEDIKTEFGNDAECTIDIVEQEKLEPEFIEFENYAECTSNIVEQEKLEPEFIEFKNYADVEEIKIETTKIESASNKLQANNTCLKLKPEIGDKQNIEHKCLKCNKILKGRQNLLRHDRSIHQINVSTCQSKRVRNGLQILPSQCNKCDASFRKPYDLKRHYNRVHEKETKPFRCKKCGYRFVDAESLNEHKAKHLQTI